MTVAQLPTLFTPIKVGNSLLQHRIVLAPLTRFRADDEHVHTDIAIEYYEQRASTPGTLLISEGTFIAPQAGGYPNVPGIWSDEQVAAWRKVTDAVHAKQGFIFAQIWALGRTAFAAVLEKEGPYEVIGPSAIPLDAEHATPRPLTKEEIKEYVQFYAQAAKNAVRAGFDGVEIHSANGYLLDQFLQTNSNTRTDEYGGSIENRIRFVCEVLDAVAAAIGPERTAIRFSPWSSFQKMRMPDPKPTFGAVVEYAAKHHPNLAYIHAVEARADGFDIVPERAGENNDFIRDIWAPRPLILAGGITRELALKITERDKNVLVGMGRHYISNPDLPKRWLHDAVLTPYKREYFYTKGTEGSESVLYLPKKPANHHQICWAHSKLHVRVVQLNVAVKKHDGSEVRGHLACFLTALLRSDIGQLPPTLLSNRGGHVSTSYSQGVFSASYNLRLASVLLAEYIRGVHLWPTISDLVLSCALCSIITLCCLGQWVGGSPFGVTGGVFDYQVPNYTECIGPAWSGNAPI
ncbi:unnamed protein product [Peniophora sp. CBMAI 1063]|nr:unnamed protein product [Peniophora sp. CBMAI 1063]